MSIDFFNLQVSVHRIKGDRAQLHEILVIGISTCAWCKKALKWLDQHNFSYTYFFIDEMPLNEKEKLKKAIEDVYNVILYFPILIVDKFHAHPGFNPQDWELLLLH